MRPQDMYPSFAEIVADLTDRANRLALLRTDVETWNPDTLRTDEGSPWTSDETLASLIGDLDRAEHSIRSAAGNLESAWSALGRLSSD